MCIYIYIYLFIYLLIYACRGLSGGAGRAERPTPPVDIMYLVTIC